MKHWRYIALHAVTASHSYSCCSATRSAPRLIQPAMALTSADALPASLHAVQSLTPEEAQVMLDDKDRIFRNLYGLQDWARSCRRRGAWTAQGDHRQGPRLDQ